MLDREEQSLLLVASKPLRDRGRQTVQGPDQLSLDPFDDLRGRAQLFGDQYHHQPRARQQMGEPDQAIEAGPDETIGGILEPDMARRGVIPQLIAQLEEALAIPIDLVVAIQPEESEPDGEEGETDHQAHKRSS